MGDIGKWLMICGVVIVLIGAAIWLLTRLGIPFGQLPGDISVEGSNYGFYFPIISSILLSLILTIAINVFIYLFKNE